MRSWVDAPPPKDWRPMPVQIRKIGHRVGVSPPASFLSMSLLLDGLLIGSLHASCASILSELSAYFPSEGCPSHHQESFSFSHKSSRQDYTHWAMDQWRHHDL